MLIPYLMTIALFKKFYQLIWLNKSNYGYFEEWWFVEAIGLKVDGRIMAVETGRVRNKIQSNLLGPFEQQ